MEKDTSGTVPSESKRRRMNNGNGNDNDNKQKSLANENSAEEGNKAAIEIESHLVPLSSSTEALQPSESQSSQVASTLASTPESKATTTRDLPAPKSIICPTSKLYIGNLHRRVSQLHLEKLMQPYGAIQKLTLVTHQDSGESRGFAFCEYAQREEAAAAIERLHGRQLLKRPLIVRPEHITVSSSSTTSGSGTGQKLTSVSAHKQQRAVESKIEAVKRKLERLKNEKGRF